MTRQHSPKQYTFSAVRKPLIVLIILLALLLADLQFQGLAWRYFYSQTGEESIVGQIQGMVEVAGNLIRLQPRTDAYQAIQHNEIFPYGINTFFEQEVSDDKLNVQFQMIADAGFGWIRQEFPWEDIEIDGRGQFTDSRFDYDGDGELDTIDAWEKYDNIVDLAETYDLDMIVRLSNPPAWSRADNPETEGGAKAPPDDLQDFVNYAVAVAERYQGQIRYYQVWNEPNIYPEWGEQFIDPVAYAELLCMTYDALKALDPNIVVISGTIAPTASIDGWGGYHDLVFLQNIYDNGAGDCFDVLSAQGYGLNSGPTDRRMRVTHLSYARHVLYRDIMVANGDAHKPIWLSEVAWSPMLEPCLETGECLSTDDIGGAGNFGAVSNEQSARYLTQAYERAQEEWSWIGHISYWHFTRPTIEDATQVAYWFRMVEADYSPENPTFSPLPVYTAAQTFLTNLREHPVLYRGNYQAESWEISVPETAQVIDDSDAIFGQAVQTEQMSFTAQGVSISIRIRSNTAISLLRDDEITETILPESLNDGYQEITLSSEIVPQESSYVISSSEAFVVDSIIVRSEFWLLSVPALATISAILGAVLILAYRALKYRRQN